VTPDRDVDDGARRLDRGQAASEHLVDTSALERDVDAGSAGQLLDPLVDVLCARVEDYICPGLEPTLTSHRRWFYENHLPGSGRLQYGGDKQTDRTGTEHRGA
jgi:hypothetical protein